MSTKEIKAALKAAKSSIQTKDYETALGHCDVILKKDSENYNALVFAGLCYSEIGNNKEAREKYKNAIKSHPDQILAYQGLSNLYTKHWKGTKTKDEILELITVFEKLVSATDRKDPKKRIELSVNFCNTLIEAGEFMKALENLNTEVKEFHDHENTIKSPLYEAVFKVLESVPRGCRIGKFTELIDESFSSLFDSDSKEGSSATCLQLYLGYLSGNLELLNERVPTILNACAKLNKISDSTLPLQVMVQAYVQNYKHPSLDEINEIVLKLNDAGGKFAEVGLGYLNFKSGNFEDSFIKLKSSIMLYPTFLPGWVILCKSALTLHKYADAKILAKKGLTEYKLILNDSKKPWLLPLMPLDEVKFELSKCLAISLCGSHLEEEISTGVETFQKLLGLNADDIELQIGRAGGLIKLEKYAEASNSLEAALTKQPDNKDAAAWIAYASFKVGDSTDGISELESISPPTPLSQFLLSKCLWEAGGEFRKDKKYCFSALVKAAKLDPHRGEIFFLLGNFYSKVQRDNARAKGCYQKAYQLEPRHQETAACLADTYVAEGDTASAIEMYENITKELGSAGGKWAWLRLGLYKLKAKDMTNAIQCFQSALRIDSEDSICWECLGEGYLQRGSLTAAWKAFDRAHQLNSQSVYSLYQMAKVKQVQGFYPQAISEFTDVLKIFPDYVPALQGLGESELLHARQMFHEGRFQTGIEHLENAIKTLTTACCLRKDLCCLWKLLGDCCAMVRSLDESVVNMRVPSVLLGDKQTGAENVSKVGKSQVLSLSTRFYCRAVQLQSENASLWHDLGVSYFWQAENSNSNATDFAAKATNAIRKSITLEPTNHVFWCSLGVIAASCSVNDPSLAQHCFLMSIKHEGNNVQAWSNLATLYLAHDDIKMAHEAFKVAQSLEPSFTNSWVGQAIIAETVGSDETMDLYRHSTELGLQKQGASGYCSWVARVISDLSNRDSAIFKSNIRDMNAVAMATTQISKMCIKDPTCAWMSTIYGFLLELSGLNLSAEKAYHLAFDGLKKLSNSVDNEDKETEIRSKNCAVNLARSLCKNGKFDEAIALYTENIENLDVFDVYGLALAFFKSGQYDTALDTYQKAGQMADKEDDKAQIMVAMAITYWKMGKQDEAKTLLYQCFQNCKPGLQVLLSLGIAIGDNTLVGAAVGELIKKASTSSNEKELSDDCMLIATAAKLFGDPKMALNQVQKALHRNPSSWSLRVLLSRLLVELQGFRGILSAPLISNIAERLSNKQCLSNPLHRDSELWKSITRHNGNVEVERSCALSAVSVGSTKTKKSFAEQMKDRIRRAQKFAHMHPYDPSSWTLLSCACHARDVENWIDGKQPPISNSMSAISRRCLSMSENQEQVGNWVSKLSRWNSILNCSESDNLNKANPDVKFISLLDSASKTENKAKLQTILKEITSVMGDTTNPALSSRYFAELLEWMKMYQVSRKMLEKSISLTTGNEIERMSLYFRLFQLSSTVSLKDESKCKEPESVVKNTVAEIVKIDAKSSQSLLFQGLAARFEKNHRKAKSFFNRVLNLTTTIPDVTRSVAIWNLYRTLHERNDSTEITKLVDKGLEAEDPNVSKIVELLPIS